MKQYHCKHCGKTTPRTSTKKWVKSFCEETGKNVHLQLTQKSKKTNTWETPQVMSDSQLDKVELPKDVVSIPNPNQIGTKNQYLVGKISHPTIKKFRKENGLE